MSRSYNKNTVSSNTMTHSRCSEKKDKDIWHRKYRRISNRLCNDEKDNSDFANYCLPNKREVSNVCKFCKDGKRFISTRYIRANKSWMKVTKQLKFRK